MSELRVSFPPTTTTVLWPDPAVGPWAVEFTWHLSGVHLECGEVRVRPAGWMEQAPVPELRFDPFSGRPTDLDVQLAPVGEAPTRITTSLMRSIPFAELIYREKERLARETTGKDPISQHIAERVIAPQPQPQPPRRSGRRPLYGAEHFAEVARIYRDDAVNYGSHARPTQAVADHFGVPRSTANKWVARARRMGLIPEVTK